MLSVNCLTQHRSLFHQIREFVQKTSEMYGLNLRVYDMAFSDGLKQYMSENGEGFHAFALGTRKGDPNFKGQVGFDRTDSSMCLALARTERKSVTLS